jgi:hypothetical protein
MADYELHADYNHNGRLEATSAEYALRARSPGAILVPNLDADARRLPSSVALGSRITLDRDQPVLMANDDEALRLRVLVNNASAPVGSRFVLRPEGFARIRIRINDAAGRILPWDTARPTDITVTLPGAPGVLDLTLSTRTLPGSPFGRVTDLNPRFELDLEEESAFLIRLLSIDPAGVEAVHDEARFTIAPFVILDNASNAVRVYICDQPNNQPSVMEMQEALRPMGIPLVTVPLEVSRGDTWLQDQFQHALIQGPDGWRQVVLHMPRQRANSSNAIQDGNLSGFVLSHFPSRDIGVFDDLWARELEFLNAAGRPERLSFRACDRLAAVMFLPDALAGLLIANIKRLDPRFEPDVSRTGERGQVTWGDIRGWLPELLEIFRRNAERAAGSASPEWQATLQRMVRDAASRLEQVASRLPFNPDRGLVGLPSERGQIEVTVDEANRIFLRVQQMHHSANYGGNVEASPPTPDAPLGKIVIGNTVVNEEREFMDPDLLRLLYKQRKQPIVQLNSAWLQVGHVDEFMAFVPDRRGAGASFAVLRASSALALRLLQEAEQRYLAGLSEFHPHQSSRRPSGVLPRLTMEGPSPVTRLFRGKVWSHIHERPTGEAVPQVLEPPGIYQDVAQAMNGGDPTDPDSGGINIHDIRFWPGEGPERAYPADITVRELLYGEEDLAGESTNAFIETHYLAPAGERLREEFPQARPFPLPVLFDRVPSTARWSEDPTMSPTGAFTPDVVNLQVVNGRLLVPRPYGPRMKLSDAIAVIQAATAELDLPDTLVRRINERFVRTHRLNRGMYWLRRQPPVYRTVTGIGTIRQVYQGLETEEQVIAQFRDSFPGATADQLRRRIIQPNRRHFDARGYLRQGWRPFVIEETMVDIFETYIQAVAAELDAPLSWIDSWFYHVHAGGIHCGTNVLRMPARPGTLPNVWNVADLAGAESIQFEGEEITVPAR